MFGYLRARRDAKRARRAYDLAMLESLIAANNRRLAELEEARNTTCQACETLGPITPSQVTA